MSKPGNHIDELDRLGELLIMYGNAYSQAFREIDPHGNGMSPFDGQKAVQERSLEIQKTAKQQLDQYYADFYRNKIPEKQVTAWLALNNDERLHDHNTGYNQAIDDITAQFNSKEGSDE